MKTYTIIAGVSGTGKSSLAGVLRATFLGSVAEECIEKNISFIQETTLTNPDDEYTVATAKGQGYYIRMHYVGLNSLDECLARIKNRVRKGGCTVPEANVHKEFDGRWAALNRILPYCDEVHFFDNDNGFVEVAEYRNGEVVGIGELRPEWLRELQGFLYQTGRRSSFFAYNL